MLLTMLGVGNGFSKGVFNNNALVEADGEKTLIDCGTDVLFSLYRIGLKEEDIDSVFVTHMHFDHVGGLEALALHTKYVSHRKIRLIVPEPLRKDLWDKFLSGPLSNSKDSCFSLDDYFIIESPNEGELFRLCGNYKASWFSTRHIKGKFSCGLVVDKFFAYTSDMVCDSALMEAFLKKNVRYIFHDCQMVKTDVHAYYDDILNYSEVIQKHLVLMHHGLLVPNSSGPLRYAFQHEVFDFEEKESGIDDGIADDKLIGKTISHMKEIQSSERSGHDWLHTKRVYTTAMRLARSSKEKLDLRIVALAALLHDISDWKFNQGNEEEGPSAARQWLISIGASSEMADRIGEIIKDLSFKGMGEVKKMKSLEGMIVQDADRLDAIGAIGVARAFATGAVLGNYLLDPDLPPRAGMTKKEYADRTVKSTTLNHFYEKLLHVSELLNTPQAKAEAVERQRFMIEFLDELFEECNMTQGIHQRLLESF